MDTNANDTAPRPIPYTRPLYLDGLAPSPIDDGTTAGDTESALWKSADGSALLYRLYVLAMRATVDALAIASADPNGDGVGSVLLTRDSTGVLQVIVDDGESDALAQCDVATGDDAPSMVVVTVRDLLDDAVELADASARLTFRECVGYGVIREPRSAERLRFESYRRDGRDVLAECASDGSLRMSDTTNGDRSRYDGWVVASTSSAEQVEPSILAESNRCALLSIGGRDADVDTESVGAILLCGHYDSRAIAILADAPYSEALWEMVSALDDYPLIDESAHSELEYKRKAESWEDYGRKDAQSEIAKRFDFGDVGVEVDFKSADRDVKTEYETRPIDEHAFWFASERGDSDRGDVGADYCAGDTRWIDGARRYVSEPFVSVAEMLRCGAIVASRTDGSTVAVRDIVPMSDWPSASARTVATALVDCGAMSADDAAECDDTDSTVGYALSILADAFRGAYDASDRTGALPFDSAE